jgi:hypothetical protein
MNQRAKQLMSEFRFDLSREAMISPVISDEERLRRMKALLHLKMQELHMKEQGNDLPDINTVYPEYKKAKNYRHHHKYIKRKKEKKYRRDCKPLEIFVQEVIQHRGFRSLSHELFCHIGWIGWSTEYKRNETEGYYAIQYGHDALMPFWIVQYQECGFDLSEYENYRDYIYNEDDWSGFSSRR